MSRLFEVEIIVRAVVVADTMSEALHVAYRNRRDMVRDSDLECDVVCEIKSESHLPEGWDSECIPYGSEDDSRIGDYLDNLPPERDTRTIDMFGAQA